MPRQARQKPSTMSWCVGLMSRYLDKSKVFKPFKLFKTSEEGAPHKRRSSSGPDPYLL